MKWIQVWDIWIPTDGKSCKNVGCSWNCEISMNETSKQNPQKLASWLQTSICSWSTKWLQATNTIKEASNPDTARILAWTLPVHWILGSSKACWENFMPSHWDDSSVSHGCVIKTWDKPNSKKPLPWSLGQNGLFCTNFWFWDSRHLLWLDSSCNAQNQRCLKSVSENPNAVMHRRFMCAHCLPPWLICVAHTAYDSATGSTHVAPKTRPAPGVVLGSVAAPHNTRFERWSG